MADTEETGSDDVGKTVPLPEQAVVVEPAKVAVTPAPSRRRSVLWPLIGGVLAAAVGFGAAQLVPNGWPIGATTTLQAQLADEVAQVKTLQGKVLELVQQLQAVSSMADRVAKLEAAPPAAADPQQITALEARVAALENRPASSGADPAAVAALRADVEALKASGAGVISPELQASLDAKVKETEAKLAAIETSAKAQADAAMTRAAIGQLAAALDRGAPYAAAVADLAAAKLPAVLTDHAATGLPTLQSLQSEFPEAARTAIDATLRSNMGTSWSDRMKNFLRSQTGARALSPREGNDPDAILSRAEAALAKGDLPATLTEIAALPPEGQAALHAWQARAQLRLDAITAVQALSAQAG
jgi:hypothetical protein